LETSGKKLVPVVNAAALHFAALLLSGQDISAGRSHQPYGLPNGCLAGAIFFCTSYEAPVVAITHDR